MRNLDCSSFDSALETVAALLDVSPGHLLKQLRAFDLSALPEEVSKQDSYDDLLSLQVTGTRRHELPVPESIMWFHATRVPPDIDFHDGILPLACASKRIDRFMTGLIAQVRSNPKWKDALVRRSEHGGWNHATRLAAPGGDPGPFAFLVRDAIFEHKKLGDHHYLGVPECIADLYLAWDGEFGQALRAAYLEATEPCIVMFQMPGARRSDVLGSALMYLHCVSLNMDLRRQCNTCFDGEGVAVPPNAIVRIERGAGLEV